MNADSGEKRSSVRTFGCSVVLRDPGGFERSNLRTSEPANALSFHIGVYRRPSAVAIRGPPCLRASQENPGSPGEEPSPDGDGPGRRSPTGVGSYPGEERCRGRRFSLVTVTAGGHEHSVANSCSPRSRAGARSYITAASGRSRRSGLGPRGRESAPGRRLSGRTPERGPPGTGTPPRR